jgi:hypothetical protein
VALTRKQVEDSPEIGRDPPVSRQQEMRIYSHFGWEPYWASMGASAALGEPAMSAPVVPRSPADVAHRQFLIGSGMLASKSPSPGVALGEGLQFAAKGAETVAELQNKREAAEARIEALTDKNTNAVVRAPAR